MHYQLMVLLELILLPLNAMGNIDIHLSKGHSGSRSKHPRPSYPIRHSVSATSLCGLHVKAVSDIHSI